MGLNSSSISRKRKGLQKRAGVFSLEHELGSRTLLLADHVARMPKSRLPRRLMLPWVHKARPAIGKEMKYGRSLDAISASSTSPGLQRVGAPRADPHGWCTDVTAKPFDICAPRFDSRATHARELIPAEVASAFYGRIFVQIRV